MREIIRLTAARCCGSLVDPDNEARKHLHWDTACNLTALAKQDDGVRPLGVGCVRGRVSGTLQQRGRHAYLERLFLGLNQLALTSNSCLVIAYILTFAHRVPGVAGPLLRSSRASPCGVLGGDGSRARVQAAAPESTGSMPPPSRLQATLTAIWQGPNCSGHTTCSPKFSSAVSVSEPFRGHDRSVGFFFF